MKLFKAIIFLTFLMISLFIHNEAQATEITVLGHENENLTIVTDGNVDGDDYLDILIALPENDEVADNAGKVYLFLGKNLNDDLEIDLTKSDYVFYGEITEDQAGTSLNFIDDEDEDGLNEIEIGFSNGDLEIIYSTELEEFKVNQTLNTSFVKTATIGVNVGIADNVDCSLNPNLNIQGSNTSLYAAFILIAGLLAIRFKKVNF